MVMTVSFVYGIVCDVGLNPAVTLVLVAAVGAWLLLLLAVSYVCSVLEKIYIGALYVYGSEGVIPGAFDKETLDLAWKVKG